MAKPRVRAEDIGGGRLPKYHINDWVLITCGSRQDHEFCIKDVRFSKAYWDFPNGTFEYLYHVPLIGGWFPEEFLLKIRFP